MVTEREKYLLWCLLEFPINRYLMANSVQRLDGYEKAKRHSEITKIIISYLYADSSKGEDIHLWKKVHDYLADILTDRMDEVIDFPIYRKIIGNEYDILSKKFFDVIINNMNNIEKICK